MFCVIHNFKCSIDLTLGQFITYAAGIDEKEIKLRYKKARSLPIWKPVRPLLFHQHEKMRRQREHKIVVFHCLIAPLHLQTWPSVLESGLILKGITKGRREEKVENFL